MPTELFRQVRVLDPVSGTDRVGDVLVVDGVVRGIDDRLENEGVESAWGDRSGLILAPGLVDLYSHSGEPGNESRETLVSLRKAAAAGGFTRLTLLPDTRPPLDSPASVGQLHTRTRDGLWPQVRCWGALTLGVEGQHMTELAELAGADIAGFADGHPLQSSTLLRRVLEYTQILNRPIALWCYDLALKGNSVAREGLESLRLGLAGDPVMTETAPLAAVLEYVAALGTPVHLMRVSTARSVDLIRAAKANGVPITASTTWMHLLLDTTALESYEPSLKLDPPLGNRADRAALVRAVQDGTLDAIAIDHSPYTYEEKTVAFSEAPPGAIGLELALPLLWQTFVASGEWPALTLWRSLSTNAAYCLQQPAPTLQVGQPAEYVLFDPQERWEVNRQTLHSRSTNTPWWGQSLTGRVLQVGGQQQK